MIKHFVARYGNWMFQNWHLYRWREVVSDNGRTKRMDWVRVL